MTASRPLKVGLQLPEVEWEARWSDISAMALLAEEVGFDSLWVGDHLIYHDPDGSVKGPWEAWTTLAALAAITERVELGPLVAATSFHNPAMLAKKAVTVDEISGGRLILGLGAGWNETEYRAYGFPYDRRVSRFEEAFEIIRRLINGEEISFSGAFYQLEKCVIHPRGPRPSGPPIMIGSKGPRMLRITAPHMDIWNSWFAWYGNDRDRLRPIIDHVDRALERAGRDPAEVRRTTAVLVGFTGGGGRLPGDPTRGEPSSPLTGSSAQIAEQIAAYHELGIDEVQLVLDPITLESVEAAGAVLAELDQ